MNKKQTNPDVSCERKAYQNKITRETFQSSKFSNVWLDFLTSILASCTYTFKGLLLLLLLKENKMHWLVCYVDGVDLLLELLWDSESWSGRSNVRSKTRITKPCCHMSIWSQKWADECKLHLKFTQFERKQRWKFFSFPGQAYLINK